MSSPPGAENAGRTRALGLLLQRVRAGQLTDDEAPQIHERMTELKVRLLGDRVSRRVAWGHARRTETTDLAGAEHLAVTELQADMLRTVNPQWRALAEDVVPLADSTISSPTDPAARALVHRSGGGASA